MLKKDSNKLTLKTYKIKKNYGLLMKLKINERRLCQSQTPCV